MKPSEEKRVKERGPIAFYWAIDLKFAFDLLTLVERFIFDYLLNLTNKVRSQRSCKVVSHMQITFTT